jgi:hypothetical protein
VDVSGAPSYSRYARTVTADNTNERSATRLGDGALPTESVYQKDVVGGRADSALKLTAAVGSLRASIFRD